VRGLITRDNARPATSVGPFGSSACAWTPAHPTGTDRTDELPGLLLWKFWRGEGALPFAILQSCDGSQSILLIKCHRLDGLVLTWDDVLYTKERVKSLFL